MICNPNDKNNFPHKLLLANTHVADLCKAFANNSSTDEAQDYHQIWFVILMIKIIFHINCY